MLVLREGSSAVYLQCEVHAPEFIFIVENSGHESITLDLTQCGVRKGNVGYA